MIQERSEAAATTVEEQETSSALYEEAAPARPSMPPAHSPTRDEEAELYQEAGVSDRAEEEEEELYQDTAAPTATHTDEDYYQVTTTSRGTRY